MTREQIDVEGHTSRTLAQAVHTGLLRRVRQGVYRLPEILPHGEAAFIEATAYVPRGIVCLTSALSHYGLTTQLPSAVFLAVPATTNEPKPGDIPLRLVRMASRFLLADVREVRPNIGGRYRIFSPERSVCEAFRFQRLIGQDVAYEALGNLLGQTFDRDAILAASELTNTQSHILPVLRTLSS
jgi:hypothetical protein